MDKKVFPAIHKDFYEGFTSWAKEIKKANGILEGVYIVRSTVPVPRCLKEDQQGILYIGKGDIVSSQSRLGKLINSLNMTESVHGGGARFNENKILEKYGLETLTVEVILQKNSRELEIQLLKEYQAEFGELPPLNNQN